MGADTPDFTAITGRQQQTWATGDFNVVAMQIVGVAEALVAAADPRPGQRVLDVACGSGNTALVAARRYCEVIGLDYVPALVARARQRAAADGVAAEFREGDAQALPFPDRSFDVVLSTFGVMFAPDQEKAASELLRVCRPGGTIGLANWTPDGFGGDFFKVVAKHLPPPPAGLKPPSRWGTIDGLQELLGRGATIRTERRNIRQYYTSVAHAVETFKRYFGPIARAFEAVGPSGEAALTRDIAAMFEKYNRATDGTLVPDCDYLQVIATRA